MLDGRDSHGQGEQYPRRHARDRSDSYHCDGGGRQSHAFESSTNQPALQSSSITSPRVRRTCRSLTTLRDIGVGAETSRVYKCVTRGRTPCVYHGGSEILRALSSYLSIDLRATSTPRSRRRIDASDHDRSHSRRHFHSTRLDCARECRADRRDLSASRHAKRPTADARAGAVRQPRFHVFADDLRFGPMQCRSFAAAAAHPESLVRAVPRQLPAPSRHHIHRAGGNR